MGLHKKNPTSLVSRWVLVLGAALRLLEMFVELCRRQGSTLGTAGAFGVHRPVGVPHVVGGSWAALPWLSWELW